jgi:putative ABC transport system permease protein
MLLKTPFRLIHFPGVALAIAGAALVLAAVTVSTRLFLPAAGDAALQQDLSQVGGVPVLSVVMYSSFGPNELSGLSGQVERVVDGRAPRLGDPVRTLLGPAVPVTAGPEGSGEPQGGAPVDRGATAPVQLAARDGFAGHIRRLATARGAAASDGVWVPESVATALRLRPGQAVTVGARPRVRTRVAGIYQDLTAGGRPLDPFWSPLSGAMAVQQVDQPPPPLLLAEPEPLAELGRQLEASGRLEWNWYLPPRRLTVPTVQTLVPQIERVRLDISDPLSLLAARQASASSPLADAVARARATEVALTGPVETISVTGRVLALALLAAAGLYGVKRRRGEVLLLTAQGVGGARLAARTVVEALLPLLVGGALGWLLAVGLAGVLTPTGEPQPQALAAANREVLVALAVGLLLLAAVTWASVQAEERERSGRLRVLLARPLWEALLLVLAAAALYELQTRGAQPVQAAGEPARVDRFLVLFPLLLIAGLAGLAARGAGRLLARRPLRAAARPRPATFLALRRLAAAPRLVLLLVTGSALAIGILGYAGILVASTRAAALDKARVLVGSDTSVSTAAAAEGLDGGGLAATRVQRVRGLTLAPDGVPIDLLAVDPSTFAAAVHWDAAWAGEPLGALLDRLNADQPAPGRVPALLAGPSVSASNAVELGTDDLPVSVVGRASAFPGMSRADRPLLVVSADRLSLWAGSTGVRLTAGHEVWTREDPAAVVAVLREAGTVPEATRTAGTVMRTPAFLAVSWTFAMLQALGALAGLVALVGLVLYAQARQRGRLVAYALARRMGLSRGAHLRSVAMELAAMLLFSFVLGVALALVTSLLVYRRLDPMPELPPGLHLVLPGAVLGLTLLGVALAAVAGALLVQRGADRANVAEVMRLAG